MKLNVKHAWSVELDSPGSSFALSEDGTIALVGAHDGTMYWIDLEARRIIRRDAHRYERTPWGIARVGANFLTGAKDGRVELRGLDGEVLGSTRAPFSIFDLTPAESTVVLVGDEITGVLDLETFELEPQPAPGRLFQSVDADPAGKSVV